MKRLLQQLGEKGSRYDPDALAYFNQLTGSLPASFKNAVNTYVRALKAAGIWTQLDRLWLHATPNQQNARISIVNPTSTPITEVNAPTWTANLGYTGDGATDYLDLNYTPSSDTVKYTLNDCSFGVYVQDDVEGGYILGAGSGANFIGLRTKLAGNFTAEINSTNGIGGVSPSANGFWSVGRTGSTNPFIYRNGSSLTISVNPSLPSTGLPITEMTVFAYNGTPTSTNTVSITFLGSSNINQTDLNTAVQALATALGFNV